MVDQAVITVILNLGVAIFALLGFTGAIHRRPFLFLWGLIWMLICAVGIIMVWTLEA